MLLADALRWINERLQAFRGLPARYDAMYAKAQAVFEAEARYRAEYGDYTQSERETAAIAAMQAINEMRAQWNATAGKLILEPQPASLGAAALPVGAIVIGIRAVAAVAIVWAITSLLRRASPMERVVDDIVKMPGVTADDVLEAMRLSADEKTAIEEVTGGITKLVMWAVLGGIAWLMLPVIARKR